ncbi:YneF family protein [Mycoplasmatota bacterium]|nr:YneF family protein [Mycoplasmatota bacterium]
MEIWLFIVIIVVTLLVGGALGFYFSQRYTKKYLAENPPMTEKMVRAMFSQMGRKPSEKQVRQVMASMNLQK